MTRKLLSLFFLLSALHAAAQPTLQWQRALGGSGYDEAESIVLAPKGGYIALGRVGSDDGDVVGNNGRNDIWVVKLDESGNTEWSKAYGGMSDEYAHEIKATIDGGYVFVGATYSNDGDISQNKGYCNAWIVKIDSLGNIQWQKTYGGSMFDAAHSIFQTSDGGYIFTGSVTSNDGDIPGNLHGGDDFWIVKLSENGDMEWQKLLGGSNNDNGDAIKQTSDGGYIACGRAKSTDGDVTYNNGNMDCWVIKLNAAGDIEWQNTLGGTALDIGNDIVEVADGYVVCGLAGSPNTGDVSGHKGSLDSWLLKLNKTGELQWQKCMGGSKEDYANGIVSTHDGNFVFTGSTRSIDGDITPHNGVQLVWVVKFDPEGEIIWQKTFGGTYVERSFSIRQTPDLGYIFAGIAFSNDGDVVGHHGSADIWVVKLAPESTPVREVSAVTPLDITPNPAGPFITVNHPEGGYWQQITLYDLQGRKLDTYTEPTDGILDVSTLPPGSYFIKAGSLDGRIFSGKFLKW